MLKSSRSLILFVLILATLLRGLGIWHGYPFSFYGDESHFVKRALSFGSLDFNPHWFHKPALYMYLLFFEYGLYFVLGKLIGLWSSVHEFALSYITNPGPFYLIGRCTTSLFGLATILVVYLLGEKHIKKYAGVAAALLLALCYAHVRSGQDIKADIPATFFGILSMYYLMNYLDSSNRKALWASSAAAGIGAATKLYPLLMLGPLLLAIVINHWQNRQGIFSYLRAGDNRIARSRGRS